MTSAVDTAPLIIYSYGPSMNATELHGQESTTSLWHVCFFECEHSLSTYLTEPNISINNLKCL
jgi:hypothetical protein